MKKTVVMALFFVITLLLAGCKTDGRGTYYPNSKEMQNNLEDKKYKVIVETVQTDFYSGTHLTAKKNDEYIEFFWLDNDNGVDLLRTELDEKYDDYNRLVSMEEDSKFGSFVFCSTETAKDDAGIVIVEVKVD